MVIIDRYSTERCWEQTNPRNALTWKTAKNGSCQCTLVSCVDILLTEVTLLLACCQVPTTRSEGHQSGSKQTSSAMESSRLLLISFLPSMWVVAVATAARSPGCATRCGDIDVPYPFGLDPQCAIHDGFQLNCTTVGRTTKLFYFNVEVTKISVQDGKAWLKTWISRQCYNQTTNDMSYDNVWVNATDTPYVLSADDNKIIVLGCNSMAYMQSDSVSILN